MIEKILAALIISVTISLACGVMMLAIHFSTEPYNLTKNIIGYLLFFADVFLVSLIVLFFNS